MKLETITEAAVSLINEIETMNHEISNSKAPQELLQFKQKRIDKLYLIYLTIINYKYIELFEQLEIKMRKLQKVDSTIDGFLVEIKFAETLKKAAHIEIRTGNMIKLF